MFFRPRLLDLRAFSSLRLLSCAADLCFSCCDMQHCLGGCNKADRVQTCTEDKTKDHKRLNLSTRRQMTRLQILPLKH